MNNTSAQQGSEQFNYAASQQAMLMGTGFPNNTGLGLYNINKEQLAQNQAIMQQAQAQAQAQMLNLQAQAQMMGIQANLMSAGNPTAKPTPAQLAQYYAANPAAAAAALQSLGANSLAGQFNAASAGAGGLAGGVGLFPPVVSQVTELEFFIY